MLIESGKSVFFNQRPNDNVSAELCHQLKACGFNPAHPLYIAVVDEYTGQAKLCQTNSRAELWMMFAMIQLHFLDAQQVKRGA